MFITKLILNRNKRLSLLKEEKIIIEPTKGQLVLKGISGLGKSTILYELSPLPGTMRDYEEGGYKEVHISYRGKEYILISTGTGAGKHQFIVNGEELNTGNTQRIQLQLVKEYFSYTKEIHEILLGKVTFTQMSSGDRRKLFSMLSDTDMDFAMGLWNKITNGQRDLVGTQKTNAKKLVEINEQILDEEALRDLREVHKHYEELVNYFQLDNTEDFEFNEEEYNQNLDKLKSLIILLDKQQSILLDINWSGDLIDKKYYDESVEFIQKQINEVQRSQEVNQDKLHRALHGSTTMDTTQVDELENQRTQLEKDLNERKSRIDGDLLNRLSQWDYDSNQRHHVINILTRALNSLQFSSLSECYSRLPDDEYLPTNYSVLRTEYVNLMEKKTKVIGQINILEAQLATAKEHIRLSLDEPTHLCPNCQYRFQHQSTEDKRKYYMEMEQQLVLRIEKGKKILTETENEIALRATHIDHVQKLSDWFLSQPSSVCYRIVYGLTSSDVEIQQTLYENFNRIIQYPIRNVLQELITYFTMKQQFFDINEILVRHHKQQDPKFKELVEHYNQMIEKGEEHLVSLKKEKEKLDHRYQQRLKYDAVLTQVETITKSIDGIFLLIDSTKHRSYTRLRDESKREILSFLHQDLHEIRKQIQQQEGYQTIIQHLSQTQEEIDKSDRTHKKLMKLLSPKEGLIAKSLFGFIHQFIIEMNSIIKSVWTYPFQLDTENIELITQSYLFPVLIDGELSGEDVRDTSTGQSEMINFAFRLTLIKYLKLENYPLYADELGGNLNVQFRNQLYNIIKRFQEEGRVGQVFIITHLEDIMNQFSYAKVIELNN